MEINKLDKSEHYIEVYAAYHKDLLIRDNSSSGGVFSSLAVATLKNRGIVYGVAMTDDCYGSHYARIDKIDELDKLHGSKYFQTSMGDVFQLVKQDLLSGREVLFSGTVCQINGLKNFLKINYNNLITVDVICHGVPSPELWYRYARYREEITGKKLLNVNFRCKEFGWESFGIKENDLFSSKDKNPFMQMFLRDYCLRPSCYSCKVKNKKMSDITIGDFWGINKCAPQMNDKRGTSVVILRTERGKCIFENLKDTLIIKKVSYSDCVLENPAEYCSVNMPEERNLFFRDMLDLDFDILIKKYGTAKKKSLILRIKNKIKRIMGRI